MLERGNDVAWLSLRNLTNVHIVTPDQLNTYDVLVSDDVVFTQAALDALLEGPVRGKSAKAVATSTEAAERRRGGLRMTHRRPEGPA